MRFPSPTQVAVLITVATLIVCSLGVRAELKTAKNSIAEHRLRTHPAQQAAPSVAVTHDEHGPDGLKDTATQ
jgi:hypothetical protein